MIEATWHEHADGEQLAAAVASDVGAVIADALATRGAAVAAFPGGSSPRASFARLAAAGRSWRGVTLMAGDERLVAESDPLNNTATIRRQFAPLGAEIVPLVTTAAEPEAAGIDAEARLGHLRWPLDLAWLGMGADGHTASILPGPDLDAALDLSGRRAVGVRPDPLPPEAPVARVTLTRGALASARMLLVTLAGQAKRAVLEQAIEEGDASRYPIGRVLAATSSPVTIHWSAA